MVDLSDLTPEELLGIDLSASTDDTDDGDESPPNYIMVCHECGGKRITRDRACKTTRKAKAGKITWTGCGHQIYFIRDAINGLRDADILEAAKHFDAGLAHIEGKIFPRVKADVDREDDDDRKEHHLIFIPDWPAGAEDTLNGGTLHIDYWKVNDGDEWDITVTVEGMRVDSFVV